jgi:hypothetical protein
VGSWSSGSSARLDGEARCDTGIQLFAAWAAGRVFCGRIALLHRGRTDAITRVSGLLPGACMT